MKRYRLLAAAGTVLGLAVTACGSIPQTGVSAPGTAACQHLRRRLRFGGLVGFGGGPAPSGSIAWAAAR